MKRKLSIEIIGETGTGKSTVAKIIEGELVARGAKVNIVEDDIIDIGEFSPTVDKRFQAMAKRGLEVTIKMKCGKCIKNAK